MLKQTLRYKFVKNSNRTWRNIGHGRPKGRTKQEVLDMISAEMDESHAIIIAFYEGDRAYVTRTGAPPLGAARIRRT